MAVLRSNGSVRGKPSTVAIRVPLLAVGILVTQLGAIAVNAATARTSEWPLGLETVRQHPFTWAAGLTVALGVVTVLTAWLDSRRTVCEKARADAELLVVQLSDVSWRLVSIGRMLRTSWFHLRVLKGTRNPLAKSATNSIYALPERLDVGVERLRPVIDWALHHLDTQGGPTFASGAAYGGVVDRDDRHVSLDDVRLLAEDAAPLQSVGLWVSVVVRELRDLERDLHAVTGALNAVRGVMGRVGDHNESRRALLSGLGVDCEQWRAEVAQAATDLQEYLSGIGVNVAAILHDGTS
jgi:hypothetical protein